MPQRLQQTQWTYLEYSPVMSDVLRSFFWKTHQDNVSICNRHLQDLDINVFDYAAELCSMHFHLKPTFTESISLQERRELSGGMRFWVCSFL